MAYYMFLKSLRSLEEFRKNPHVKIPPKSPSTNFQSLGKFKNPIFNSEILFPCFRLGRPCGPLGLRPSQLPLASPLPQASPCRSARARGWRNCRSALSPLIHAFRLGAFSLSSTDAWVPCVSPVFPTAPADRGRKSPTPPLCASDAAEPLQPPSSLNPLIPFKPSLNALNAYSPRRYSGHPSQRPPPAL
jgi:hypothetical protein